MRVSNYRVPAALGFLLFPLFATAQDAPAVADTGDTAWLITATALVLFMTLPGLALFYAGLVRTKNVLSILIQCFAITCVVSMLWLAVGYSLIFSDGGGAQDYIGGLDKLFLKGVTVESTAATFSVGAPITEYVYICFQMTFAAITPALIVGAFAERMKFSAVALFIPLWNQVLFPKDPHCVQCGHELAVVEACPGCGTPLSAEDENPVAAAFDVVEGWAGRSALFDDPRIAMLVAISAIALVLARHYGGRFAPGARGYTGALAALAASALTVYLNFFNFHGAHTWVHLHDVAHYYLGAKYFDELGYEHLYTAMMRAEAELTPGRFSTLEARDLSTNELVPIRERARRRPGRLKGKIWMSKDFDAPMTEAELALFEGEPLE